MPHVTIRPFVRNCICPPPARQPGEHEQACEENYRAEFMGAKQQARDDFYGTDRSRLN